ncbi:Uncharacterised protein [Mycobacteroides abscessus subsp. abscessus]|nr:Uncharacterised protein [Mycobacteroides abscessus subsp. abscessus]
MQGDRAEEHLQRQMDAPQQAGERGAGASARAVTEQAIDEQSEGDGAREGHREDDQGP